MSNRYDTSNALKTIIRKSEGDSAHILYNEED